MADRSYAERQKNLHRSRSGGYADFLEEKTQWDRRNRERQMKRYHDSHLSPTHAQPAHPERLYVPTFETTHRRTRSHEHIDLKDVDPQRNYKLREAVPARLSEPGDESASPHRNELTRRPTERSNRPRRPSIKVQVHQDAPPPSSSAQLVRTPSKSSKTSPRSPSAVPQLQFQYATLQHRLKQVGATCTPYVDVEPAHPRDLTFAKIVDRCEGFAFELAVWSDVVNVGDMARIDARKRAIVEATARTLDRLISTATALDRDCETLKPGDLKVVSWAEIGDSESDEDEDGEDDDDDDDGKEIGPDITQSPAFIIQSHLSSMQTQLQTLKRLSRSLQEATPGAKDEVIAVENLVAEADRFFGSQEKLDRYRVDTRLAGRQALKEARYVAATHF